MLRIAAPKSVALGVSEARSDATASGNAGAEVLAYAVLLLFFLQLLTAFVAGNYAFGLLDNRLPPQSASAVLLLSPLLLVLPRRRPFFPDRALVATVVASRLAFPLLEEPLLVLLASGTGVAAFLLVLPSFWSRGKGALACAGPALGLALAASITLRAAGSGLDLSAHGAGQLVAWPAALSVLWLLRPSGSAEEPRRQATAGGARVTGLCLGITSGVALIYLAFGAPNVLVAWTGADYLLVHALLLAGLLAAAQLLPMAQTLRPGPAALSVWAALVGGLLLAAVLAQQVDFPAGAAGYPLLAREAPAWSQAALLLACLLSPVAVLAVHQMAGELQALAASPQQLGLGFGLGGLLLGTVATAQILTSTYDYVPAVGPLFRDRFWLTLAVPVAGLAGGLMLSSARPAAWTSARLPAAVLAALALCALTGALAVRARPHAAGTVSSLVFVSFNVEQGYSLDNRPNIDGQLDLLRSLDADVIGLQESETNRVAGGNNDLVRYFANRLDMYAYSGPSAVAGTFGIALLSRYPIEDASTFYLYSEGEQTAAVRARLAVKGRAINILVTHLGNGGPMVQLEQVLSLTDPLADVVLLGDFNFLPDTPQYRLAVQRLDEAWAERWPSGSEAGGASHLRRIDYVFASRQLVVRDAGYVETDASDHPVLAVEIEW